MGLSRLFFNLNQHMSICIESEAADTDIEVADVHKWGIILC